MACYLESWPLLVVCPSLLVDMWVEELRKWLPPMRFSDEDQVLRISSAKVTLSEGVDAKPNLARLCTAIEG